MEENIKLCPKNKLFVKQDSLSDLELNLDSGFKFIQKVEEKEEITVYNKKKKNTNFSLF